MKNGFTVVLGVDDFFDIENLSTQQVFEELDLTVQSPESWSLETRNNCVQKYFAGIFCGIDE